MVLVADELFFIQNESISVLNCSGLMIKPLRATTWNDEVALSCVPDVLNRLDYPGSQAISYNLS